MKRYLAIMLCLLLTLAGWTVLAEGLASGETAQQEVDPSLIPPMRPVSEVIVYYTQLGKY